MISLKNIVDDQMDSFCFPLRNRWIVYFLVPIFTFVCGNFIVFIITGLILGSSAFLLLTYSKHNAQVLEQEDQHHYQEDEFDLVNSDDNDSNRLSNVVAEGCLNPRSPDSCFESEIIDQFSCTTEVDSDLDGSQYSGKASRIPDCTDGSISDEESLIEIELPGGHYVGYKTYKDEEPKFCRRQRSPDTVLWWPEMIEEENMIEIDISMGSIKYSRF